MSILSKILNINNTSKNKNIQGKKERETLKFLSARYSLPDVRVVLLRLNNIRISSLVNGHNITEQTLYNTLHGRRNNPTAKQLIADALDLEVSELYPEENSP